MTLAGVLVGCGSGTKSPPTTSRSATSVATSHSSAAVPAPQSDYTGLLIKTSDINAPENFTATPPINNPNGQPGATTTFSNQDRTHVIVDSIQVFPDVAAAVGALESVTVLLFTEGRAFVELEFDGPPDALVPPDFVTDAGQKQDAAVKKGLVG
jgi:hypothetical protein